MAWLAISFSVVGVFVGVALPCIPSLDENVRSFSNLAGLVALLTAKSVGQSK